MSNRTVTAKSGRRYTLDERHRRQPGISAFEAERLERADYRRWQVFCAVWSDIAWQLGARP